MVEPADESVDYIVAAVLGWLPSCLPLTVEIVSYMIIDFVDCNIPAVFAVGPIGAVEKLDDTWQMPVQFRSW
jgi:hypothetical protein